MGIGCGVVYSCTFHMLATHFLVPSRTMFTFLFNLISVVVNVDVHPPSHSCPMVISDPDWRWGEGVMSCP